MDKKNIESARKYIRSTYPDFPIPEVSYLGLMTPRSGSTLFCTHMQRIGYGNPIEAFNPNKNHRERFKFDIDYNDPTAFIGAVVKYQTQNNVMGMKFSRSQFKIFLANARKMLAPTGIALNDAEVVDVFFPNTRYIHLQRRNKIKQAISFSKALQSGIWNETVDTNQEYRKYVLPAMYDREHIESCYDVLLADDIAWQYYLEKNELPSMLIWFEDLIGHYDEKMKEVYAYLKIKDKSIIEPPLRQQSNKESLDWEGRFRDETPWTRDEVVINATASGDLATLWMYRSNMIVRAKETERWQKMPSNRFKVLRTLGFRISRKLRSILKK